MSTATIGTPTVIEILNGRNRDFATHRHSSRLKMMPSMKPALSFGTRRKSTTSSVRSRAKHQPQRRQRRAGSPVRGDGRASIEPSMADLPAIGGARICADGGFGSVVLIEA
jgi:hypothetical protein